MLTVVLTLRGRHLHTLRWLWHANRTRLPFGVVVADGEVHPTVARLLSDPRTFPNLELDYRRYEDRSFTDFYRKCADALRSVRTPYAMMSDNDDFLFPSGIAQSLAFLDGAPDYVSAGGGVGSFAIQPRAELDGAVLGDLARIAYPPTPIYRLRDLAAQSATTRALDELQNFMAIYYNVYRTDALRLIAEEIHAHDFSDLEIHEYYSAVRATTLGKIKANAGVLSYFRQMGTYTPYSFRKDWVDHLLRSRLPQDIAAFASTIAQESARADGTDATVLEEQILRIHINQWRGTIASRVLRYRFPRLFKLKLLALKLKSTSILPAGAQRRLDEKRLWRKFAAEGADSATLARQASELREIQRTLRGEEFLQFVRAHASDLLLADAPTRVAGAQSAP